jgi:hypothetical protein
MKAECMIPVLENMRMHAAMSSLLAHRASLPTCLDCPCSRRMGSDCLLRLAVEWLLLASRGPYLEIASRVANSSVQTSEWTGVRSRPAAVDVIIIINKYAYRFVVCLLQQL